MKHFIDWYLIPWAASITLTLLIPCAIVSLNPHEWLPVTLYTAGLTIWVIAKQGK